MDDEAKTIATLSEPIPEQWIADVDQLEAFLDGELRALILEEINAQLVSGAGGDDVLGLLNVSGVQVQPWSNSLLETLRKARTKVGTVYDGLVPDFVLLHPLDAERLDLVQDNEGRYYLNRGPVGAGPDDPEWRTEVVEAKAIAEGAGLMGNFAAATRAIVREEAQVTWSNAPLKDVGGGELHALFETNEQQYRAEARVGLELSRPAALVQFPTTATSTSAS